MARWRAVPTAVSTAVGALAFLASAGLAVVLGAGLHVWSGPAAPGVLGGHPQSGPASVTGRVGGVVTVTPPAAQPQRPQPGSSGPGPSTVLPFVPFVPAAQVPSPPVATPAVPPATGPGDVTQPPRRGGRGPDMGRRAFLRGPHGVRTILDGSAALRTMTHARLALRADRISRPFHEGRANARGHHRDGEDRHRGHHGGPHFHGGPHHHAGKHSPHGHGHGHGRHDGRHHGHGHGHHDD